MKPWLALLALAAAVATPAAPAPADDAFDAVTGYRIARYRSPTPATAPGGKTITLDDLLALRNRGAVLIDVTPSDGGRLDAATGTWFVRKPHVSAEGAVWLPDVGKGTPDPTLDTYFRKALAALTKDDPAHAIVIYCQADCWMSWNAVKRAADWGYSALHWYPEGTDGMRDWDVPLVPVEPYRSKP